MSGEGRSINSNYKFWKYAEVLELSKQTVANTRPELFIKYSRTRIAENDANAKRKHIFVFNTVEQLNKHPHVCISYFRVLASAKGMSFTIKQPPQQ